MRLPQNLAALWAKKNDLTLGKNLNFKAADSEKTQFSFQPCFFLFIFLEFCQLSTLDFRHK